MNILKDLMKALLFRVKVKKLDELHIRQYLERIGFDLIYINSEKGQNLISKLKINNPTCSSFIYNEKGLKYVFLAPSENEDDKVMTLLHECGHISYNHQTISKHNEAQAWSFAYKVKEMYKKICDFTNKAIVFIAIVSMVM